MFFKFFMYCFILYHLCLFVCKIPNSMPYNFAFRENILEKLLVIIKLTYKLVNPLPVMPDLSLDKRIIGVSIL